MNLKNQIQSSLAIFTAFGLALAVFLIYPLSRDIKDNATDLFFKKQDLIYLDAKLSSIERFKKDYKEIRENLEKAESLFAQAEAPVDFIEFLEQSSSDSNVAIKISPSPVTESPKEAWPFIIFEVDVSGSFANTLKFIEKIESGPFLAAIEEFAAKRLESRDLNLQKFSGYSVGDAQSTISIKVFTDQTASL